MVKIISDSTCDLSPELIAKYDIDILPLHILLGEDEYEDGKNITPEQIYSWSDENKTTPKTSAPALTDAIELFKPYIDEGREIVCFSISSSMFYIRECYAYCCRGAGGGRLYYSN